MPVDEFDGGGQMPLEDENVVAKAELVKRAYAFVEILTQNVAWIGFVLNDVPHAAQSLISRKSLETPLHPRAVRERNPSHHAADQWMLFRQS